MLCQEALTIYGTDIINTIHKINYAYKVGFSNMTWRHVANKEPAEVSAFINSISVMSSQAGTNYYIDGDLDIMLTGYKKLYDEVRFSLQDPNGLTDDYGFLELRNVENMIQDIYEFVDCKDVFPDKFVELYNAVCSLSYDVAKEFGFGFLWGVGTYNLGIVDKPPIPALFIDKIESILHELCNRLENDRDWCDSHFHLCKMLHKNLGNAIKINCSWNDFDDNVDTKQTGKGGSIVLSDGTGQLASLNALAGASVPNPSGKVLSLDDQHRVRDLFDTINNCVMELKNTLTKHNIIE